MESNKCRILLDEISAKKGMNLSAIAKAAGINRSFLSNVCGGRANFTENVERKIKDAFPDIFDTSYNKGIPYYDVDFCLGYDVVFDEQTSIPTSFISHPLNGKAQCWVTTRGQSMSPLIEGGDMIALREVSLEGVMFGDVYAIVTDENRTIKRIRKGSKAGKWLLVPENKKDFDEQEVSISSIIKVFRVEAVAKPL